MTREPSLATLKALAEAVSLYAEMFTREREESRQWPEKVMPALLAYRAEIAPRLRTRAEVDAERLRNLDAWSSAQIATATLATREAKLCAEPTAPEGETPEPAREYCGPCYVNGIRQAPGHPGSCAAWKAQQ